MTDELTNDTGIPAIDPEVIGAAFAEQFARVTDEQNGPPVELQSTAPAADDQTDENDQTAAADGGDSGTDDAPTGRQSQDDDQTRAEAQATQEAASTGKLSVPLPDGTTYDIDEDTAQRLLALASWSQALPQQTREQFAAIESGQSVAISRAEYDQFAAWQQTRQSQQQPDTWAELDAAGVDPQIIAGLRAQEQRILELQQQQTQQYLPQAQTNVDLRVQQFEAGVQNWASTRGISDPQVIEQLNATALQSGVIKTLVDNARQYSPTGVLLVDADLQQVAARAMDYALIQNPDLHTQILSQQVPAAAAASAPPSASSVKVEQKKARAASVAAAPSTAVPSPSGQPQSNSVLALTDAMAQEFSRRMGGDSA